MSGRRGGGRKDWRTFEEAREFARSLGLKGHRGWLEYCRCGQKPGDIPSNPQGVYKNAGWTSWGDFLGTSNVKTGSVNYRPFAEAREFAGSLSLKNKNEWVAHCKFSQKPDDIPADASGVYKGKGWTSWGDFLGTSNKRPEDYEWRPFAEAREFTRSLGLKSQRGWLEYCRSGQRPDDIPASPARVYKNAGWAGMGDWLGTRNVKAGSVKYRPFAEAREYARSLGIKTGAAWAAWAKTGARPPDIPASPASAYRGKGWVSWADFLDTRNRKGGWRSFAEVREFARSLGLKNGDEWREYAKTTEMPDDIPSNVRLVYKSEWTNWGDFLGTGNVASRDKRWRPFDEARDFVRSLSLRGQAGWRKYLKTGELPSDIPSTPDRSYKEDWTSWGDWLGTGNRKGGWRPFEEARELARTLALGGLQGWRRYARSGEKPDDIPSRPDAAYIGKGWVDWDDFLGTGNKRPEDYEWRPFEEAREHARSLGLKTTDEWTAYAKSADRPDDIPAYPREVYEDQWVSMGDWLGTRYVATFRRQYRSYEAARAYVRSLGLKSQKEWEEYARSGKLPDDIPRSPWHVYGDKWKRR